MSHILIVEDESVIRSALRRLLERHDYQVSDAESVDQALERNIASRSFHVDYQRSAPTGPPGYRPDRAGRQIFRY